jgi:hypothetical protein
MEHTTAFFQSSGTLPLPSEFWNRVVSGSAMISARFSRLLGWYRLDLRACIGWEFVVVYELHSYLWQCLSWWNWVLRHDNILLLRALRRQIQIGCSEFQPFLKGLSPVVCLSSVVPQMTCCQNTYVWCRYRSAWKVLRGTSLGQWIVYWHTQHVASVAFSE